MFAEDCHYYYSYMVEHLLWVRHRSLHKLSRVKTTLQGRDNSLVF